eukprot:3941205-Rhodomonas_salina.1
MDRLDPTMDKTSGVCWAPLVNDKALSRLSFRADPKHYTGGVTGMAGDGWAEMELSQAFGHEYVMEQKEREIKVIGLHEDVCRILGPSPIDPRPHVYRP